MLYLAKKLAEGISVLILVSAVGFLLTACGPGEPEWGDWQEETVPDEPAPTVPDEPAPIAPVTP